MRMLVPYQAVSNLDAKELIISQPGRCSHCNTEPAARFETHRLMIKADQIPFRQIGRKYRIQHRLLVRLPLCESCYLKGYLIAPDTYAKDDTPLGVQSRRMDRLANIAGILAGVGIILLTPFIPAVGLLTLVKSYWYVVLGAGLLILGIAWGIQRNSQARVRRELGSLHTDSQQYPRADLWTEPINGKPEPTSVAITVKMENEIWLNECARLNEWRIED